MNAGRGHALAEEFELDVVMLGSGNEFRRLDDIVAMGREFVLPVDFPDAPVVRNAEEADSLSLRDLMTWMKPRPIRSACATRVWSFL